MPMFDSGAARDIPQETRAKGAAVRRWGVTEKFKLTPKVAEELGIEWRDHSYVRTASTDERDRYGDRIDASKWTFTNYMAAGAPVLWAHNRDGNHLPIGTALKAWTDNNGKVGRLLNVHHYHGETELSRDVRTLVAQDILRASSVGFMPDWEKAEEIRDADGAFLGVYFRGQDLLEDSITPIPAHPGALVGRDFPAYRRDLERLIEEPADTDDQEVQAKLREAHQALRGPSHFVITREAFDALILAHVAEAVSKAQKTTDAPEAPIAPAAPVVEPATERAFFDFDEELPFIDLDKFDFAV